MQGKLGRNLARLGKLAGLALFSGLFALFLFLAYAPRPPLLENVPFGKAILARDGRLLRLALASDDKYRLFVSLGEINPCAVAATLHYEDRHFYNHPGVNVFAVFRSFWSNLFSSRKMGASTISMQVARLTMKLDSSSLWGKLRQIVRALVLERHYGKADLLQAYFNLAPYGGNIEGIEAASRIYFGHSAATLVEAECEALALVPQNPIARNPVNGKKFAEARERLWRELHPDEPMPPLRANSPGKLPFLAPHLAMELEKSSRGGTIYSAIDYNLQKMLEKCLASFVARGARQGLRNAAAILVDCDSMEVAALAGSASFFDKSIQGQIDGSRAKRSPGSTLKPFIYALALDQGLIHPMSILADTPKSFGGYDPQNFDHGFAGPVPAATALRNSRNLPAITLAGQLVEPGLFGFLQRAQVSFPRDAAHYGLALALGGAELSPRDLAGLYAMLVNKGIWRPLALTRNGETLVSRRLLSPEAAWLVLRMLSRPEEFVTSQGKQIPLPYKTGTSNGLRDAWTCGVAGKYVIVVWVGNFDNRANPLFVGAKTALPLFREIAAMLAAAKKLEDRISQPESDMNVAEVEYCATTGDFDLGHCPRKDYTWIIPGVSPARSQGIMRQVLVDRESGLRLCGNGNVNAEERWLEFWPTDMLKVFQQAGINKPLPPEWHPDCAVIEKRDAGKAPAILLPKKRVVYHRRQGESSLAVPLRAATDMDVKKVYWYAGNEFLGESAPGEVIYWQTANVGSTLIRVVDETGRAAAQNCLIEMAP